MDLTEVSIAPMDPRSSTARSCLTAYAAELAQRFPEGYQESDLVDPSELTRPQGVLLVAVPGQEGSREPVGVPQGVRSDKLRGIVRRFRSGKLRGIACGGVRTIRPGVGEIRHMWVHPEFRRAGLGRRMLGELEQAARELGLKELRLGTHRSLNEAIAMYRVLGYVETEVSGDTAHTDFWFAKTL